MKVFQSNRRWVSISLIITLFALVSFSMMPLITSILQTNRADSSASVSISQQKELESRSLGYEMVLEREPDNQNALRGLLETRLYQGNLKKAIEPLEKLAYLNPQQSDYLILLARTKEEVQDYEGAVGTYRALLASHPEDIRVLKGLTDLLMSQNRGIEAINAANETIDKGMRAKATDSASLIDVVSVQLLLGELYFEQKNYAEALKIYERASTRDPQDFRPILAKAIVFKEQGKTADAEPLFKEALNRAPVQYKDEIKTLAASAPTVTAVPSPES